MTTQTKKWMDDVLASKTLGYTRVLATMWPRDASLRRLRTFGKITGYAVTVVHNGVATLHEEFPTRKEAEAYYNAL